MISYFRTAALCTWTDGLFALEAAVELLARAAGGPLLNGLWICNDPDVAAAMSGNLSGGERLTAKPLWHR